MVKINVTTCISDDIWNDAKKENISWNDALEFGIKYLIANNLDFDYPDTKQGQKIIKLIHKIEELNKQLNLKEQEIEDNFNNVFNSNIN